MVRGMGLLTLAILAGCLLMANCFYASAKDAGMPQLRSEFNGLAAVWVWLIWVGGLSVIVI